MITIVSRFLATLRYLGSKLPVRRLKIKHYVGITGACITVVGWLLTSADNYPLVYRITAPKYSTSVSALNRMQFKDFVLKDGDDGFREISEILEGYLEATLGRQITEIKALDKGADVLETPEGMQWDKYIELEVSFSNEPSVTGKFYGLESKIEQRYLTSRLFAWKGRIFWLGIVISLIALFM
jgi:hypothetical protein